MDRDLKGKIMVSLLLLLTVTAVSLFSQELTDTSAIAKSTSDAYAIARRNPDIAVIMSHQSMSASRKLDYKKGIADASLALGMAYLAKYNPGDSAFFYNAQALSLYEETEDRAGMGRAC